MINLLSPQAKQNIHFEEINRRVMFFGEVVFSLAVLFAALLFSGVLFADMKLNLINRDITQLGARDEIRQVTKFNQQLRTLKNDIERINRIQEQHVSMYAEAQHLLTHVEQPVRLLDLDIDMAAKKIVFSGTAPTRQELIDLKDSLQRDKRYADMVFPLANLLKETNIPFSFSLTIVPKP